MQGMVCQLLSVCMYNCSRSVETVDVRQQVARAVSVKSVVALEREAKRTTMAGDCLEVEAAQ